MQLTHLFVLALSFVAGVASQDTNLGAGRGAFNDANVCFSIHLRSCIASFNVPVV